jgi:phage tail-like protein
MPQPPYAQYNFSVDFGGAGTAFHTVVLPVSWAEVIEYREGGDPLTVRKLAGLRKFSNMILKRGLTQSTDLYDWWRQTMIGSILRRDVVVTLLDENGQAVKRWVARGAWPVRYEGPRLNAEGNDVAMETLELTVEGFELV